MAVTLLKPRQVGKTTLVSQLVQKYKSESLVVLADALGASNTYWLEQPAASLSAGVFEYLMR